MPTITTFENWEQLYAYQMRFSAPYFFSTDFGTWKQSFLEDVDGEGRPLFRSLWVKAVCEGEELLGFVQYGYSAFGFGPDGNLSQEISYPIIRNLYFAPHRRDIGCLLLREALEALGAEERVYAFFHYFGMSCFARHGKLFECHSHIAALLQEQGFVVEHENVYYSSVLKAEKPTEVAILPQPLTHGGQQYCDFLLEGQQVGGCEVHFVSQQVAYLRWIYVQQERTGQGVGTKCMRSLRHWLAEQGITRFDTDTALNNPVAQHFYEKTGFTREGITRSYYQN